MFFLFCFRACLMACVVCLGEFFVFVWVLKKKKFVCNVFE